MVSGISKAWKRRFVTVDVRLLQRIAALWPKCVAALKDVDQPHEKMITFNLYVLLSKDEVARSLGSLRYPFEPSAIHLTGFSYSTGIIDMAVVLDQDIERYIAYECKRLNVRYNGKNDSLAGLYVEKGMMRFVEENYYSDRLPVGCMLGYVMDGDVNSATKKVRKAILDNKGILGLISGPFAATPVNSIKRFLTNHKRPTTGTTIEIRHAFLAFLATLLPR